MSINISPGTMVWNYFWVRLCNTVYIATVESCLNELSLKSDREILINLISSDHPLPLLVKNKVN